MKTKRLMRSQGASAEEGAASGGVEAEGQLIVNTSANNASFVDMFKGEEAGNAAFLDLGKIQMFFFTLVTWFVYAGALGKMLQASVQPGAQKITAFPDLDAGMIALLGISHAAYLANKAVPHTPQPTNGDNA